MNNNDSVEVATLKLSITQLETALKMNDKEFLKSYAVTTTLSHPKDVTEEFAKANAMSNLSFLKAWLSELIS